MPQSGVQLSVRGELLLYLINEESRVFRFASRGSAFDVQNPKPGA